LVPFLIPIIFYALGTFVCFMQAFVPTVLTMIYIMLATQHEEGEQHQRPDGGERAAGLVAGDQRGIP